MSSYTNLETTNSPWAEKPKNNRRQKITVVGSLIAVVAIVAAAVVIGVVVAKHHKSSSSTAGSPIVSNPNDPSDFQKDSQLHQSFWGLAYTPEGSQLPQCGASLDAVIEDIQLMSQLTKNIRMYGPDCNQTFLVMDAIQQTKVDMKVYAGLYPVPNNITVLEDQLAELEAAFKTFGVDIIEAVIVGNEFMLDYLTDNGGAQQDINGPVANQAAEQLIQMVNMTRVWWSGLGYNKTMSFCTADAGSYFNEMVIQSVDCLMANEHAYFAGVPVDQAAAWVDVYNNQTFEQYFQALSTPPPPVYIAETGWPSGANDSAHDADGAAVASISNLQVFLNTFVCQANQNNTKAFFFEAFDETWKNEFGGVEAHWGLFYANKTLKPITIPECSYVPS